MSTAALAWREFRFQRRMFWRNPSAAFFNFALPLIFLVLIASVFSLSQDDLNHFVPGIAGMAVLGTTFTALAYSFVFSREQGILKRIRGTPMPPLAYFGGLLSNAVANAVVQVGLVVVIGHAVYGLHWPRDWLELAVFTLVGVVWPQDWGALAVFAVLGVVCFAALGVALSHVIPNPESAPAYVNAVFLPMILIAGVFYDVHSAPQSIRDIAEVLPLKHIIDGLYGALVSGKGLEHHLTAIVVLLAWCAAGLLLAVRYFRWE